MIIWPDGLFGSLNFSFLRNGTLKRGVFVRNFHQKKDVIFDEHTSVQKPLTEQVECQ